MGAFASLLLLAADVFFLLADYTVCLSDRT